MNWHNGRLIIGLEHANPAQALDNLLNTQGLLLDCLTARDIVLTQFIRKAFDNDAVFNQIFSQYTSLCKQSASFGLGDFWKRYTERKDGVNFYKEAQPGDIGVILNLNLKTTDGELVHLYSQLCPEGVNFAHNVVCTGKELYAGFWGAENANPAPHSYSDLRNEMLEDLLSHRQGASLPTSLQKQLDLLKSSNLIAERSFEQSQERCKAPLWHMHLPYIQKSFQQKKFLFKP